MINQDAQVLFSQLLKLMPSSDQQNSLKALMKLLLEGDGNARPEHSSVKSPTALSRFLNLYPWNTRSLIRELRQQALQRLERHYQRRRGRKPLLYASIDLTTLEKRGEFPELPIYTLNGRRGLHLVVLYLVVGEVRIPWGFRVWRGPATPSPAKLALKLLCTLPSWLKERFRVRVLADGQFGSVPFKEWRQCDSTPWWACAMTASSKLEGSCMTLREALSRCSLRGYPCHCGLLALF